MMIFTLWTLEDMRPTSIYKIGGGEKWKKLKKKTPRIHGIRYWKMMKKKIWDSRIIEKNQGKKQSNLWTDDLRI